MWLMQLLVLGAVTYRVTRFIIRDTLIDGLRWKVRTKLLNGDPSLVRQKLMELLSCPYCLGIWVSAGAVGITLAFDDLPQPVWSWLAVAAIALAFWRYIEAD